MTHEFCEGQRFISDRELGLGSVHRVSRLSVTLVFRASGESREYSRDNAPVRRVRFHKGDRVKDREGRPLVISAVDERHGLIHYSGDGRELGETELLDALGKPEVREGLLPALLRKSFDLAQLRVRGLIEAARGDMAAQLDHEIVRLRELRQVNPSVWPEEIDLLLDQKESLDRHIKGTRLRLDAVRLIQRGPG